MMLIKVTMHQNNKIQLLAICLKAAIGFSIVEVISHIVIAGHGKNVKHIVQR